MPVPPFPPAQAPSTGNRDAVGARFGEQLVLRASLCFPSAEVHQQRGAAGLLVVPACGSEDDCRGAESQALAKDGHHWPLR